MVLEARFVSSCLIFPSRAMPLRSRLLASKGTSVSVVVRVLFGGTFSLQEENQGGGLANCSHGHKATIDLRSPYQPPSTFQDHVPCLIGKTAQVPAHLPDEEQKTITGISRQLPATLRHVLKSPGLH